VQPGLVRNTPRQPHRPPEVPAQERVGLFAPGNRTATLHLDGDLAAVLVDLGGHLEQPPHLSGCFALPTVPLRLVKAGQLRSPRTPSTSTRTARNCSPRALLSG